MWSIQKTNGFTVHKSKSSPTEVFYEEEYTEEGWLNTEVQPDVEKCKQLSLLLGVIFDCFSLVSSLMESLFYFKNDKALCSLIFKNHHITVTYWTHKKNVIETIKINIHELLFIFLKADSSDKQAPVFFVKQNLSLYNQLRAFFSYSSKIPID